MFGRHCENWLTILILFYFQFTTVCLNFVFKEIKDREMDTDLFCTY